MRAGSREQTSLTDAARYLLTCGLASTAALAVIPASVLAQRSVYIEDLTWPEVQQAIAAGKTSAIIYTRSTEHNGPHMAIGKHNFIARWVAGALALQLGDALVYPTLPFPPTGHPGPRAAASRGSRPKPLPRWATFFFSSRSTTQWPRSDI